FLNSHTLFIQKGRDGQRELCRPVSPKSGETRTGHPLVSLLICVHRGEWIHCPASPARAWTLAPTFGWMGNRSRFNYGSYRRTHPSHQLRGRHQHHPPPHQRLHSADGCRRAQASRRKYPFRQHQPEFCSGPTGKGAVVAEVQTIAVIGAGRVGRGIAQAAARGGFRTILEDLLPNALRRAESEIRSQLDWAVGSGGVSADAASAALSLLEFAGSVEDAARQADLVIEAVPEELESKIEIFTLLDKICRPGTIL